MLRTLVVMLALANLVFFAWTQGVFNRLPGFAPASEREPDRLLRQVRPEQVRVLTPQAASAALATAAALARSASGAGAAASAASGVDANGGRNGTANGALGGTANGTPETSASACLEAGPFAETELPAAERALRAAALPPGAWTTAVKIERKGSFLVYMGRYADRAALLRKQDELKRLKLNAEELRDAPELQPGLSLAHFADKTAAEAELARLVQRGLRSAKVVTLTPPVSVAMLRIPAADAALRARLDALRLPPGGLGFAACASTSR